MPRDVFSDAAAVWEFGDAIGEESFPYELRSFGGVDFVPFPGEKDAARPASGDGRAVRLRNGYLSLDAYRAVKLRPKTGAFTFFTRIFREKNDFGCVFSSDWFSLTLTGTGLAIARLGTKVGEGSVYRELPLCSFPDSGAVDLAVTADGEALRFYCGAVKRAEIPLRQKLCSPFLGNTYLGAFLNVKPDTYGTDEPTDRFRGLFVDTAAIWHRALSREELARLSGKAPASAPPQASAVDKACLLQNAFFDASAAQDAARCAELWRELRALAAEDATRPLYHLTQPFGFLFDPCGAFYAAGEYHVFSYHNVSDLLNYSSLDHYASGDLVHWTARPIGPFADSVCDVLGIYLMNFFRDESGRVRALYTGQGLEGKNGILADVDETLTVYTNKRPVLTKYHHDGHVFRDGGKWFTITSKMCRAKRAGGRGDAVMLWSSEDLERWTEEGEIFCQKKDETCPDGFMEFPYLLSFGEKDVLILGGHPVRYWVGSYDREAKKFLPDRDEGRLLDETNPFHCDNPLCVDRKGPGGAERRLLMALYTDVSNETPGAIPWWCAHCLPRVLTLAGDRLRQEPVPELAALRGREEAYPALTVRSDVPFETQLPGNAFELSFTGTAPEAGRERLVFLTDADPEEAALEIDFGARSLKLAGGFRQKNTAADLFAAGKPFTLRVFGDRKLIEVFLNGASFTTSLNALPKTLRLRIESEAPARRSLTVWEMRSPDRV